MGEVSFKCVGVFRKLLAPHKEAFNFTVGVGLEHAVQDLLPEKLLNADGKKVRRKEAVL